MAVVLVVNCGSSSLKYQIIDTDSGRWTAKGLIEGIGTSRTQLTAQRATEGREADRPDATEGREADRPDATEGREADRPDATEGREADRPDATEGREADRPAATHDGRGTPETRTVAVSNHTDALRLLVETLGDQLEGGLAAVGHRVVHGGTRFTTATRVDDEVEAEIEQMIRLAPLHQPANLLGVRHLRALLPDVPHVAVFDTAFHATVPAVAHTYAIPQDVAAENGFRRYGFHGTSHQFVCRVAAEHLAVPVDEVNLVTAHIGNGVSLTAVERGRSVDTSMGLSPLEGLVMGTRSGDLDPTVAFELIRLGWSPDDAERMLNRDSGLRGLCGHSDVRTVRAKADEGDAAARAALDVYAYRLRKYIGAYLAVVPGVHALVFTGGVGENDPRTRAAVCEPLAHLGLLLDPDTNTTVVGPRVPHFVDRPQSAPRILVVPTDEELEIATQSIAAISRSNPPASERPTGAAR